MPTPSSLISKSKQEYNFLTMWSQCPGEGYHNRVYHPCILGPFHYINSYQRLLPEKYTLYR